MPYVMQFESGPNVFWINPPIYCYRCDKILKYLSWFYLELLAWWWFYVLRYSRLLQNMQIKWSKPSSREKGWFPRTSYSTSATRNPQQISKARHLLSLLLAANTTGVKRRKCLFFAKNGWFCRSCFWIFHAEFDAAFSRVWSTWFDLNCLLLTNWTKEDNSDSRQRGIIPTAQAFPFLLSLFSRISVFFLATRISMAV